MADEASATTPERDRAAEISLAGVTLEMRALERPPLSERAIRQRFVKLTSLATAAFAVPSVVAVRLVSDELVGDATVLVVAAFGVSLVGLYLWARRSQGRWAAVALIALFVLLPVALAASHPTPASLLAAPLLLVIPVIAASSLLGPWSGVVVAALAAALTLVAFALGADALDPATRTIAELWTLRLIAVTAIVGAIGAFFSSSRHQLLTLLRRANHRLAAKARRQGALASLGQRALSSYAGLIRATVDQTPQALGVDHCAYIEGPIGDDVQRWRVHFTDAHKAQVLTIPDDSVLYGALHSDTADLINLGAGLADERLCDTRCLVVSTTLGDGRRAALLSCARDQRAIGDEELPFVQTALSLLSTAAGRETAEVRQSRSEARFAELVKLSPDGIITVDRGGSITSVNPAAAALIGRPTDALIGREIAALGIAEGDDELAARELIRDALRGDGGHPRSLWIAHPDGERRRIEVNAKLSSSAADSRELVAILRDVTERHHLEEQLRLSQRLESLGLLAGGVAHDFNNILTVVITSAALLRDERIEPEARELVDEIFDAGERAATLTNQLLAFSRRQVLSPRYLDLRVVLRDLEKMLRRLIGEDIELIVDVAGDLGTVYADRSQVEQALINLCVNARAAMPGGGILMITARRLQLAERVAELPQVDPGAYVHLKVSDTGVGMDEATQARIFEPFFTTKGPGEGTGLGLAMVHGFVQQSGGHIWPESKVDRGSVFHILLPARESDADDATREAAAVRPGHGRIMVIEDEPLVRAVATRILVGAGYEVVACDGPAAALNTFADDARGFDLILSDVVMPGMSGMEVIKLLRLRQPALRALLVSGYPRLPPELVDELHTLPLLRKPFTPASLTAAAADALAG